MTAFYIVIGAVALCCVFGILACFNYRGPFQ
jgi:hypothetical protein